MEIEELVRSAKKGNDQSFYQLMDGCKELLYRIAYSYLKNEADSLEAIQEVTLRAYIGITKLKEPRYFKTWVIRIMINYCLTEMKKRKRFADHPDALEGQGSGEQEISSGLNRIEIDSVIAKLDPKYQTVIRLKYLHDLTIAEIAQTMGKPEGTVKTWLHKALSELRKHLERMV